MCKDKLSFGFILVFCLLFYHSRAASQSVNIETTESLLQQKEQIMQLFQQKKYAKVYKQLEVIWPLLTSKSDRLEMQFLQAYCSFYRKQYEESSNQFHSFIEENPTALKREEAVFMRGYSLSFKEVDLALDQTVTHTAVDYLEQYVADYPAGCYLDKAINALQALRERLLKKSFHVAYFYFRLGYYRAATVALKSFEQAYPDSAFQATVDRLLLESKQKLAKMG